MKKEITIGLVTREQFIAAISDKKEDNFAKTFRAKCDMMKLWEQCFGLFENGELCSAVIFTTSKNKPYTANLQLIHTFYKHRNKGYGKQLTLEVLDLIIGSVEYLRVSAEKTAVGFYEKLGFKFLGVQKSGTQLSMCKVTSDKISKCKFDKKDEHIWKCLNRNGRGGCVEIF